LSLLFGSLFHTEDLSLNEIRILYQRSPYEKITCKKLVTLLQTYNETNNPTLAGYKACATMIMAKYSFNPINKLSNFIDGKNLLEKCINADNKNTELRLLRFTVQDQSPSFLGYKASIADDKIFLINAVSGINDKQLKELIIGFLKTSEHVTATEKNYLK
jgi:hypothetical protein